MARAVPAARNTRSVLCIHGGRAESMGVPWTLRSPRLSIRANRGRHGAVCAAFGGSRTVAAAPFAPHAAGRLRGQLLESGRGPVTPGAWLSRPASWLALLAVLVVAELVTHSGSRNPFLESTRPVYSAFGAPPHSASEGYLTFACDVPVQFDSTSFFVLVSLFMGEHGPEGTGILDHRAGYAYLASLAVPWAGPYLGFMVLNALFWWGAAIATWWVV